MDSTEKLNKLPMFEEKRSSVSKLSNVSFATSKDEALSKGICPNRCGNCCKWGSGYVLLDEIDGLAKGFSLKHNFKITPKEFEEKYLENSQFKTARKFKLNRKENRPYGPCVFFKESVGCTIQEIKPLHCRIGTCTTDGPNLAKWFMVNHLVDWNSDDEVIKYLQMLKTENPLPGFNVEEKVPKHRLEKIKQRLDHSKKLDM